MKALLFLFLVLVSQTAFSQNQPITVLNSKWYEKVDMRIIQGNEPFSAANSEIPTFPDSSNSRQTVGGVRTDKYFVYEMTFKNESNQNIIGIAWDYVFFDSEGKIEKTRKKFNFFNRKIKKNRKETLIGSTTNPPELVLNAKDYKNVESKLKELVEINCVVFEDKTTWKRDGVDEKVCEELRIQIKKREERLKKYR